MKGLKGVLNDYNIQSEISKKNLVDHVFCIIVYVGKIETNGKITVREKCKNFTNTAFVKQDLMKLIDNVMDPFKNSDIIFNNAFNTGIINNAYNRDNFYYNRSAKYERKPDEFIILSLTKMYNRDVPEISYSQDIVNPRAYFDKNAEMKQRTFIQQYVYKILENVEPDELADTLNHVSTHENCIDLIPLDYIVLKPIQPIKARFYEGENSFTQLDNRIKDSRFVISSSERFYSSSMLNYQKLNYINHYSSIMKFISKYEGLGAFLQDEEYHEMENPLDHLDEIEQFVSYAAKQQQEIIKEDLIKMRNIFPVWARFSSLNTDVENSKPLRTTDFIKEVYDKGFRNAGLSGININKLFTREKEKGGDKNEKEINL